MVLWSDITHEAWTTRVYLETKMVKKSPPAYKLRKASQSVSSRRNAPSTPPKTPFYLRVQTFILVFIVGFVIAVVPDIMELKNVILKEASAKGSENITGPFTEAEWYSIEEEHLPVQLRPKFVLLHEDEITREFLVNSTKKSHLVFRELTHSALQFLLKPLFTATSIMGILGKRMFLFSGDQFLSLISEGDSFRKSSLMDLGAGYGTITELMGEHFEQTSVTELSTVMNRELRNKGFSIADATDWHRSKKRYDVIACLNVLDRCNKPRAMLENIRKSLKPGGLIIISFIYPFTQYVETGRDHLPEEHLHVSGDTFEEQVSSLSDDIFRPLGFSVVRFTKLPYFSEGTLSVPFYHVDAAVFVLQIL